MVLSPSGVLCGCRPVSDSLSRKGLVFELPLPGPPAGHLSPEKRPYRGQVLLNKRKGEVNFSCATCLPSDLSCAGVTDAPILNEQPRVC